MKKIPWLMVSILPIFTFAAGCSSNQNINQTKPIDSNNPVDKKINKQEQLQLKKFVNTLTEDSFNFETFGQQKDNKSKVYFQELKLESKEEIKFKVNNSDNFKIEIIGFIPERDKNNNSISNITGNGFIKFKIFEKNNEKNFIEKDILFTGFNKNQFGADSSGKIILPDLAPNKNIKDEYAQKLTQLERFKIDNKNYIDILKRQLGDNININEYRPELKINLEQKNNFNAQAELVNQDSYDNAKLKGFTLPSYNQDGTLDGLIINDLTETPKGPSWVDIEGRDRFKSNGLPRYLVNQKYKDIALQTFQTSFSNKAFDENGKEIERTTNVGHGTMWILDYQKRNDEKYPTKWYFATNLHVAKLLTNNTVSIRLTRLKEDAPIHAKLKIAPFDTEHFESYTIPLSNNNNNNNNNPAKIIFTGNDFLKKDPKDYLAKNQKEKFKNAKEFVDFAVIEIDFEKIKLDSNFVLKNLSKDKNGQISASQLSERVTANYANQKDKQIKFLKKSYLNDYSQINVPLLSKQLASYKGDSLYALGYPIAIYDGFLDQYEDSSQIKENKHNFSLWINSDANFYDNIKKIDEKYIPEKSKWDKGDYLSYQIGYRNFIDKPGILDEFISHAHSGSNFFEYNGVQLINFGLSYTPKHYSPGGGASGSSVRNQNNELVGIFHTGNPSTNTGVASAFRSEGYDYKGIYGLYNLPQYDLIFGGGKDQQNSYRQALSKIYQNLNNIKTALFSNGLNEIPIEYKFNK